MGMGTASYFFGKLHQIKYDEEALRKNKSNYQRKMAQMAQDFPACSWDCSTTTDCILRFGLRICQRPQERGFGDDY